MSYEKEPIKRASRHRRLDRDDVESANSPCIYGLFGHAKLHRDPRRAMTTMV